MTTPAAPVNLPPQQCPPPLLGHCARCQAPCLTAGGHGGPSPANAVAFKVWEVLLRV